MEIKELPCMIMVSEMDQPFGVYVTGDYVQFTERTPTTHFGEYHVGDIVEVEETSGMRGLRVGTTYLWLSLRGLELVCILY